MAAKPQKVTMSSPDLTGEEREAVAAVLRTPNLSMGAEIDAFEEAVRQYTGTAHAIGVCSGTAGLHLCVHAAGISTDDLVITTPFSFVASTNVLLFERAVPVFVDVDPQTGNLDVGQVRQAVADLSAGEPAGKKWLPRQGAQVKRPKAILSVDVFGQPADMDPIQQTAQDYGLKIIEDSCEALGATYKFKQAGTMGDYGVFGFYPNKQVTTGEGGMVITNDDQAALLMRSLRNQGRTPGDTWLSHTYLGYNYRMDEMSAALGRVQMQRLDEMLAKRERVATWYHQRLATNPAIQVQQIAPTTTRMSWFVYVVRFTPGIDRQDIASQLGQRGVPARPYFIPIHLQPYMVERFGYQAGDYPITEDLGQRGLALPFSGVMTEEQVDFVCQALEEIC